MAKLEADASGFLTGRTFGSDNADRVLAAIKRDTAGILALMRGARATGAAAQGGRTPGQPGASSLSAAPAVARATAVPIGRAGVARSMPARGDRGRFISAADAAARAAASPAAARSAAAADAAVVAVARTIEASRRDDKAREAAARASRQARGKDGRFGNGNGDGGGGGALGSLGVSAGAAVDGASQLDPMLAAANEARGAYQSIRNVVSPIGRAGRFLFARGGEDKPTGMLRRMWRELRGMRRDAKERGAGGGSVDTGFMGLLSGLGGSIGGGIAGLAARYLPAVLGVLGGVFTRVLGPLAAIFGSWKLGEWIGGKIYEWLDKSGLLEKVFDGIDSIKDAVGSLWNKTKDAASGLWDTVQQKAGGAWDVVKKAGGAVLDAGKSAIGWVSKRFESGGAGAGAISTGRGDAGGKSYGTHQLSSKTGTLQQFLASSPYGAQFAGLTPGSPEFDAKWKALAAIDPGFAAAQQRFMVQTHYGPQMAALKGAGIDLSGRGAAVQEAVFSTSTQFGPRSSLIRSALAGRDVASMSDADIVNAIQDYKIRNNASLFRSSSAGVQASTLKRAEAERAALLALATSSPSAPRVSSPGGVPSAVVPGPTPSIDTSPPVSAAAPAAAGGAPTGGVGQDVADRSIAHIVTGGIGANPTIR